MTYFRALRVAFAVLLLAGLTALSAGAQQDNTWVTGDGTHIDFSSFGNVDLGKVLTPGPGPYPTPTPLDVPFVGKPLDSSHLGSADTLVQSGLVDNTGGADLILEALSMESSTDISVTDSAGTRTYHVKLVLSQPGSGHATFTQTAGTDGGTYDSNFTVTALLTFTNVSDPTDVKTVDCIDQTNNCSFLMTGTGGSWVISAQGGFDPLSLGIPIVPSGVTLGSYTTVGRPRFGAVYPGVVHTTSGYSKALNNEFENAGKAGHGAKIPQDCLQPAPTRSTGGTPVPIAICASTL